MRDGLRRGSRMMNDLHSRSEILGHRPDIMQSSGFVRVSSVL